jgi:hypothetical protein
MIGVPLVKKIEDFSFDLSCQVQIRDVLTFPLTFWLLSFVCLSFYVAIFPFISLGQVFFMKKFDFEPQSANFITGEPLLFQDTKLRQS